MPSPLAPNDVDRSTIHVETAERNASGRAPPHEALGRLAIELGAAADEHAVLRTLRVFIQSVAPVSALFVSRYEASTQLRTCVYAFSEGEDLDVASFPPMPNTGSPHSRSVETGETILTRDFQEAMAGKPRMNVGVDRDPRLPQSSLVVPMKAHDRILGAVEIQSTSPNAFTPDHVATLELAANIAALAGENVHATKREARARADLEARAALLETRAQERVTQLATKNRELEAFSFTVAHDLRAPLRGILNLTEAVLKREHGAIEERSRDDLAAVVTSSERMARLVEDLLKFARTSQGAIKRELVDMSSIAREILAELEHREPQRKAQLDVEPNLYVQADPMLVRLLLENLLGNAWKYSRRAEVTTIRVGAKLDNGEIAFCVRDNGVGFTQAQSSRIFMAFERLAPNEFEGTGVGLATAQRIVQRHGGRIWAEGRPDEGATFWFTLQSRQG